jgi:hypothetical protein
MKIIRRLAGLIATLISGVGIIICGAGIVGTWTCHHRVTEKVNAIWGKLDGGLERVSTASQNVRRASERARAELASVRTESAGLDGDREAKRRSALAVHALLQRKVGPNIDELGGRLGTLADTATAASSLLQTFQEVPLGRSSVIDPDELTRRAGEAQRLSAILQRLDDAVGDGDRLVGSIDVKSATSEVDLVLQRCQRAVEEWQTSVDLTRQRLGDLKEKIVGWLTWAAIVVTVLVAWVGAGQISLFAHGVKWCRG